MCQTTSPVESKHPTTTSLMKKTKAQLVDIILRKDELERKLRKDLTDERHVIQTTKLKYNTLRDNYGDLKREYEEAVDEAASLNVQLQEQITRYKTYLSITIGIALFGICIGTILL